MTNPRSLVIPALAGTALLFLTACEDPAARQRADARTGITEATAELQLAMAGPAAADSETIEQTREDLSRIAQKLSEIARLEKAAEGQRAAAGMLAATVHRELASRNLSRAMEIETDLRLQRDRVTSHSEAARRLHALVEGTQQSTVEPQRSDLSGQRSHAEAQLREHSQRMAELNNPISELRTLNEQDLDQVLSLEEEAASLRRQAAEQGYADGLENFKQAIQREREADTRRYTVNQRELDLHYELQPQYALASRHAELQQNLLDEIDGTSALLQEYEDVNQSQAQELQQTVDRFRSEMRDQLDRINEQMSGPLDDLYRQAEVDADAAIAEASRAASQDRSGAAPLVLARAHELSGRLHWSRARSLADHIALLEDLVAGDGALGNVEQLRSTLQEMQAKHSEAIGKATEAMEAAQQQLEQIAGGTNAQDIQAFRQNLQMSIAALSGGEFDSSAAAVTGGGSSSPGPAASGSLSAQGTGASNPQELVSTLQSLDDFEDIPTLISITAPPASDPKLPTSWQVVARAQEQLRRNIFALHEAVQSQFGRDLSEIPTFAAMKDGMFMMTRNPELGQVTGDSADIVLHLPQGMTITQSGVRIGDRWYLSSNAGFDGMSQSGDISSPEFAGVGEQVAQWMQPLNESLDQITASVQAGEYSSFEAFQSAVEQQMAEQMEGAAGMFRGMGGGDMPQ